MDKRKFLSHFLTSVQRLQRDTVKKTDIVFWVHTQKCDRDISIFVTLFKDGTTNYNFYFLSCMKEEENAKMLNDLKVCLNS